MSRLAGIVLVVAALVAGCDSKTPKVAAPEAAPAGNLREDAALLASRGDFTAAERKYREALTTEPDDVDLHFGLGSVLSQLDRREDAAVEFAWVVKHGRPGSAEHDSARRWLAEAGDSPTAANTAADPPDASTLGTVAGKLTWPGIPASMDYTIRVVIDREGGPRKFVRAKINTTYSLAELPEGTYKVTGLAGPTRMWSDIPVTVTAGRQTVLDLTPANAVVSPDEFPPRAR
jgi:hypothetical protein